MADLYRQFVERKLSIVPPTGLAAVDAIAGPLFPHQDPLTRWALNRGRAAIFADTGLGKTRMQLAWADAVHRLAGHDALILAPLAVAAQTVREGMEMGVTVTHCREADDVRPGINITNYDRLHKFDCNRFGAVVLDESSIIKHHTSKTLKTLLDTFRSTPFKLCATATPAPNDWTELGTHAEFLGICTQTEMLAEYFVHDGGDTQSWRLKGHARELFWRWVATWAAMVRKPSDLGFDDALYTLPPLTVLEHHVESEAQASDGMLFALEASTMNERRTARRASLANRVAACVQQVKSTWYKLADNSQEMRDAVEAGIRGEPKEARVSRSDAARKASALGEAESGAESSGTQEVHGELLCQESTEIRAQDERAERQIQREAEGALREGCGVEGAAQGEREKISRGKSDGEEIAAAPKVRADAGSVQPVDVESERLLRNLRTFDTAGSDVSYGGPLPQDRESPGNTLLELQHGIRKVQGLRGQVAICNFLSSEQWVIWCDLNDEQDALEEAFGDLAFSVRGSDENEEKESRLVRWLAGERPVIISKTSIMGFGINMQCARNIALVGVTDSWEAYYQAVRRCWRFGQKREVHAHIFASQLEGAIVANLKRKEADAKTMADSLSAETLAAVQKSVLGMVRESNSYQPQKAVIAPAWLTSEAS